MSSPFHRLYASQSQSLTKDGEAMISNLAELIDPRPHDGNRLAYCGTTMLPVVYECEWMRYNEVLQYAVAKEVWELLCGTK